MIITFITTTTTTTDYDEVINITVNYLNTREYIVNDMDDLLIIFFRIDN